MFGIDDIIGSVAAPVIGGLFGAAGQAESNKMNMQMVQAQESFQKEMSSTAYQRATADMRAAGINPMLAYMQGGASSPMGAIAPMGSPVGAASSSAMQAAQFMKQVNLMDAQIEKTKQDAFASMSQGMAAQNSLPRISVYDSKTGRIRYLLDPQNPTTGALNQNLIKANTAAAQAAAASASSLARLNTAQLPGAQVSGSKGWTIANMISRMLFGGAGMALPAVGALRLMPSPSGGGGPTVPGYMPNQP